LKILHIITGLNTGGAEMMLFKLVKGMDKTKFSPVVITLMDGGTLRQRFIDLGVDVYSLGMKRGIPSVSSIFRLWKIIRKVNPGVIQGWMYHGNLVASLAKILLRKKVKCFWNIRQSVYDLGKEKRLTSLLIRLGGYLSFLPEQILYNSRVSCVQHEGLGYRKIKSLVIPNGFDVNVFKSDSLAKKSVRNELGLSEDAVLMGMIGRFHPMKDHYNFLCAASRVLKEYPDVFFFMAGREVCVTNGDLMRWMAELDLAGKVFLLGERSDISRLNAAMDVAVLSSNSEAFPNVVGEAMACATPCVVTDVGDAAYIVGDSGLVVPASNASALAKAMVEMLALVPLERLRLGDMARKRVVDLFSMDSVVRDYEKLYKGLN